jgi:hypothetical protein
MEMRLSAALAWLGRMRGLGEMARIMPISDPDGNTIEFAIRK